MSSVVLAVLVAAAVTLPFDLGRFAPSSLAGVPVIGQAAGLLGLFGRLGSEYSVLTANAFNPWALVGEPSLATAVATGSGSWLPDSLPVIGSIPAVLVGGVLLGGIGALVAAGLLVRDGPVPILLGFAVLALAFFVAPTRVHERYLFPFFAAGSVLAAPGIATAAALAGVALLNAANLHAVLAGRAADLRGRRRRARRDRLRPGGRSRRRARPGGFGGGFAGGGLAAAGSRRSRCPSATWPPASSS